MKAMNEKAKKAYENGKKENKKLKQLSLIFSSHFISHLFPRPQGENIFTIVLEKKLWLLCGRCLVVILLVENEQKTKQMANMSATSTSFTTITSMFYKC